MANYDGEGRERRKARGAAPSPERARAEVDALASPLLTFLAAEPDRLDRFLALTGLTPATIRDAAAGAGFAGDLFDYVSADEDLIVAFAADIREDPAWLGLLRAALDAPAPDL